MSGWIKLHRSLMDNHFWSKERFSYGQAWVDLLMMAGHQERKIIIDGSIVTLARGEILTSLIKISEKWKWSRKRTKKFLDLLEKDGMVALRGSNRGYNITICNYDKYNNPGTTGVATRVATGVATGVATEEHPRKYSQEGKEGKRMIEGREALNASLGIGEKDQVAGLAAWGAWVRDDCRPEWQAIIDQHGFEATRDAVKRIRAECGSDKIFPSQAVDALLGSTPDETPEW